MEAHMKKISISVAGLLLSLATASAMAGPGGFFQVIGQGMTSSAAQANGFAAADAVCAGQGLIVTDAEVVALQQLGGLWRAQILARCG